GAAFVPFLLLHYPTHIATGLIPCILLLAELLAVSPSNWYTARKPMRLATAILILGVVGAGSMWAHSRVSHGGWLFKTNAVLGLVESVDRDKRPILASRIEADAVRYANKHKVFAPEVWRLVGKSRLLAAKHLGAEDAFRTAFTLWPHEEAELGLGITLAARGKRTEAIPHLARVVRVNKRLESMIADQNLRRAVNDYLEVPTR
ncbi:MAG: hypothetical protein GY906_17845, partial [bacterium]|nr:hypothetical protein [bacterium]